MLNDPNSQWYFSQGGGPQSGPVTLTALRQMLASGQLSRTDLVWSDGMVSWTPVAHLPSLQAAPAPAPPPQSSPYSTGPGQAGPTYSAPSQQAAGNAPPGNSPGYAPNTYTPAYASGGYQSVGPSYQGWAVAGLVCGIFFPLLGLIFSIIALNGMKSSRNPEGKGLAIAGLVISIAWIALGCLWGIIFFAIIGAAAGR